MTTVKQDTPKIVTSDQQLIAMSSPRLPETGYVRLYQIIGNKKTIPPTPAVFPVGRSTWIEGVKTGRFPKPVKGLGLRINFWRVEDIRALIEGFSAKAGGSK